MIVSLSSVTPRTARHDRARNRSRQRWTAIAPRRSRLKLCRHTQQEILAPERRDQLNAGTWCWRSASLLGQYLQTVRTIHKLALPDRFLSDTSDNARDMGQDRRSAPTPPPLGSKDGDQMTISRPLTRRVGRR